jgi:GNAT superfamily N-acetyltransferase
MRAWQDLPVVPMIRPAGPGDIDAAADILADASAWLASKGIAQWPARFPADFLLGYAERGELYVATSDGETVGTVTLQWADPMFWGERADAGFVHRLAVRRSHAGLGLDLIRWAEQQVRDRGRRALCLDCLSDNTRLHRYYEDLGFRPVREIAGPADHPTDPRLGQWRAVLYEKPIG